MRALGKVRSKIGRRPAKAVQPPPGLGQGGQEVRLHKEPRADDVVNRKPDDDLGDVDDRHRPHPAQKGVEQKARRDRYDVDDVGIAGQRLEDGSDSRDVGRHDADGPQNLAGGADDPCSGGKPHPHPFGDGVGTAFPDEPADEETVKDDRHRPHQPEEVGGEEAEGDGKLGERRHKRGGEADPPDGAGVDHEAHFAAADEKIGVGGDPCAGDPSDSDDQRERRPETASNIIHWGNMAGNLISLVLSTQRYPCPIQAGA